MLEICAFLCAYEFSVQQLQIVDSKLAPRRDLNPCYRRESTGSDRKLLKLRNTDGYLKRFQ